MITLQLVSFNQSHNVPRISSKILYNPGTYDISRCTICDFSSSYTHISWKPDNIYIHCNKQHLKRSPPKVIWEERVAMPHSRQCTSPLHVLAVQCPLQTSPVIQPWANYIHTT